MSEPTLLMKNYVIAQWGDILTISIFYRVVVPLNNAYHQNRPTKNDDCSMFTHLYPSVLCDHFFIVPNRSWRQPWWLYIITVYHSSSYNLLLRISHSLFPLAENLGNHAVHREVRPWSWSAHLLDLFLNDFFLNIPSFFLIDLFTDNPPLSSFQTRHKIARAWSLGAQYCRWRPDITSVFQSHGPIDTRTSR